MENFQEDRKPNIRPFVWDCGSTLYDSFELKSFEHQLQSAILNSSRTLSMPHLSDRRVALANHPPTQPPPQVSKKPNKISQSLHKFLKSMFRPKQSSTTMLPGQEHYFMYDKSSSPLTTIPEAPEIDFGGFSPEINSLVGRSASKRFTTASIGVFRVHDS